jgi:signal transduction histidine kinase
VLLENVKEWNVPNGPEPKGPFRGNSRTLRGRLALHYGAVVLIALVLLAGLSYHEFSTEQRLRAALPPERQAEASWGDGAERVIYAIIPLVLIAGWWLTRRSLLPLTGLAKAVEHVQFATLCDPLPRSGNGDEVDRLAAAFNSMTARLDKSFQEIGSFALKASHELKTPLTVIRGEIESLLEHNHSLEPHEQEGLRNLVEEIQRLAHIVDALAFLSTADAGQIALRRDPVPLADLVCGIFDDALILAEPDHLAVWLGECADVVVPGDRRRLREVLLNLVDNAVKYNRPGGTITLALRQAQGATEIEIANTGAGIPPALLPRIFDRFVRGDEARQRGIDGSGLGLSMAQCIAQAHGGIIKITSEPGQQTTVTLRLPGP